MEIVLFLGSGVSLKSNLPDTKTITRSVMSNDWFVNESQAFPARLIPKHWDADPINWRSALLRFLSLLKAYADDYLKSKEMGKASYEDLFYLAFQIAQEEYDRTHNPAIEPFVSDIRSQVSDFHAPKGGRTLSLRELGWRVCYYIEDVVRYLLQTKPPKGLDLITNLAQSSLIEGLDILTVNHDCLIEELLKKHNISFADGFASRAGQPRVFEPEVYDDNKAKVRLFKLHGSVNWTRLADEGTVVYAIADRPSGPATKDNSTTSPLIPLDQRPVFLTGTYNKIMDYSSRVFSEIHFRFHQVLHKHSTMVMSGYGWNDEGINARLFEWLESSKEKRLFLLYKSLDELGERCQHEVGFNFKSLLQKGQVRCTGKYLCETEFEDIYDKVGQVSCES